MVLIRARQGKLPPALRPEAEAQDGSGSQVAARQERRRRSALYGVSAAGHKLLPSVRLRPADARARPDLAQLAHAPDCADAPGRAAQREDDDRKHREHLGFRPPLDGIQCLRDLHTTVAVDRRGAHRPSADARLQAKIRARLGLRSASGPRGWRLGYRNSVDTGSRAGVDHSFEPRDGARERLTNHEPALSPSVAVAYPVRAAEVVHGEAADVAAAKGNQEREAADERRPWCPASYASMGRAAAAASPPRRYRGPLESPADRADEDRAAEDEDELHFPGFYDPHGGLQRFPLRRVERPDAAVATDVAVVDERCASRERSLLDKVTAAYTRVRTRVDRLKDPAQRYELPVEAAATHPRAYRLGLAAVPSMESQPQPQPAAFRPQSAGTSLGFRPGHRGPNVATAARVAGARRRPHSASISYLGSATVYCMGPPAAAADWVAAASDFGSILAQERRKRQHEREHSLRTLAARGLFHHLPLGQIFARLRREALRNVDRRLQRATFERMSLDDYMNACGCGHTAATGAATGAATDAATGVDVLATEPPRFSATAGRAAAAASPALQATRRALEVTRQQLHLALEAFSVAAADVNLLFSALDVGVRDRVPLWEALCVAEELQRQHTQLRRARVQKLQAPREPPRDLELFRRGHRDGHRDGHKN